MDERRKIELNTDMGVELTEDEIKEGYHFCRDWDGLVVGPGDIEYQYCTCSTPFKNLKE